MLLLLPDDPLAQLAPMPQKWQKVTKTKGADQVPKGFDCFPQTTNVPFLSAATASAICGEKQSAPSLTPKNISFLLWVLFLWRTILLKTH